MLPELEEEPMLCMPSTRWFNLSSPLDQGVQGSIERNLKHERIATAGGHPGEVGSEANLFRTRPTRVLTEGRATVDTFDVARATQIRFQRTSTVDLNPIWDRSSTG